MLAKNNHTPVPFWLSRPLRELGEWIRANNRLVEKEEQSREEARQQLQHRGRKYGRRGRA